MTPVNQPDARPTTKVTAGVLAGALVTILLWLLHQYAGVDTPVEVGAALVTLVSFAIAYLVPELR